MDWIFDHLQIVVLVVLGIGSMVKSMFDAKSKQAAERELDRNPDPEDPRDDDTSYRKSSPNAKATVPPPLTRPATPPPTRMAGYDAEVANENAKALKHQRDLAERLRQIRENKATTTGGALATRARIASKGVAKPMTQTPPTLRRRLQNPAELRQAFVLREILDPPTGLR